MARDDMPAFRSFDASADEATLPGASTRVAQGLAAGTTIIGNTDKLQRDFLPLL